MKNLKCNKFSSSNASFRQWCGNILCISIVDSAIKAEASCFLFYLPGAPKRALHKTSSFKMLDCKEIPDSFTGLLDFRETSPRYYNVRIDVFENTQWSTSTTFRTIHKHEYRPNKVKLHLQCIISDTPFFLCSQEKFSWLQFVIIRN